MDAVSPTSPGLGVMPRQRRLAYFLCGSPVARGPVPVGVMSSGPPGPIDTYTAYFSIFARR